MSSMRGRGGGPRARSPERSMSPARRGYSRSPDRSRSRSRSPPPGYRGNRYGRPQPGGRPGGSPGLRSRRSNYSNGSDSATSSSSDESGRYRGGAGPSGGAVDSMRPPLPGVHKKEVLAIKKRESEMLGRISQLEEALAVERSYRQNDTVKLDLLTEKMRSVAERSKNRGGMLVKLIASLRHVEKAKAAVEAAKAELAQAEEELAGTLQQATGLMAEEEQAYTQPQPKVDTAAHAAQPGLPAESMPSTSAPSHVRPTEDVPPPPAGEPPGKAMAVDGPGGPSQGGWSEAPAMEPGNSTANRSKWTFKIKL